MAGPDRAASGDLTQHAALLQDVRAADFFQALRRLECAHSDQPRIGLSERPVHDPVRLGHEPSMAFAASTLARLEPGFAGLPPRLIVHFFGLLGPNGPLPLHLTEYAWQRRENYNDPTFAHFLDIFHHRMLSLFYRAWAINRPTVSRDRPREDRFANYVGALFGLGTAHLDRRDALPDRAKLFWAGRLASGTRHPEGLRAMLTGFFRVPAIIREFVAEWVPLPREARCRPGVDPAAALLGESAVLGVAMWSAQHKFRILLGPLSFAEYQRFLPDEQSLAKLMAMVRFYASDALAWDLTLVLRRDEIPQLQPNGRLRLGLTTWLNTDRWADDACDLTFSPIDRTGDHAPLPVMRI